MIELALSPDGRQATVGHGGDTLNCAVYLARQSNEGVQVSYVTALGSDPFSDEMIVSWQAEGVETALVTRIEDRLPGLYVIRTDIQGERSFYYWRGDAAVRALLDEGRAEKLTAALEGFDLLYVSGVTLAILSPSSRDVLLELLKLSRSSGARVAFDSNYRPRLWNDVEEARNVIEQFGSIASIVLPSRSDEESLYSERGPREIAARWFEWGVEEVVIKDQAAAAWIFTADNTEIIPAHPVKEVVDTTAAGDSFNGTYLACRLEGSSVGEAAEAAHRIAAHVICHRGAVVPATGY